jgi:hypothetical protein
MRSQCIRPPEGGLPESRLSRRGKGGHGAPGVVGPDRPPGTRRPRRRPDGFPKVTVECEGQTLRIEPPECIGDLSILATSRHRPDAGRGGQLIAVPEPFTTEEGVDEYVSAIRCGAGLDEVVRGLLMASGWDVHRLPWGPRPLAEPDRDRLGRLGLIDGPLLDFIRRRDRGLIRYVPEAVDPVRLVAQVALAYLGAEIAVVAAREEDVVRTGERLKQYVPEARWGTCRSIPRELTRVVVASPWALVDPPGQVWPSVATKDIVLVLDPIAALGKKARMALGLARRARLFGLLTRDEEPSPRDADGLAELFGFYRISVPRHGHGERPVEAVFARIIGGPQLSPGLDLLDLKRRGLWDHRLRNRRIARLASAFARDDRGAIAAELPALAPLLEESRSPARGVAVVVEGLEHALALSGRLPGWEVLPAPGIDVEPSCGLPGASRGGGSAAGPSTGVIATFGGLERLRDRWVDVLIRADGGTGMLPSLDVLRVRPNRGCSRLVLVDLDDRHHPALRRRSRLRREAYDAQGWIGGGDPASRAALRFLAARPGGAS